MHSKRLRHFGMFLVCGFIEQPGREFELWAKKGMTAMWQHEEGICTGR